MRNFYFKIGEFSEVCGVKKATLVHYAKIGLLPPDHIGENGYYYYSPTQIYDFELITILRSMSVPLNEIKQYMENINMDSCQSILKKCLKELREKQQYLSQVEAIIDGTLKEMDEVKKQKLDEIELVTINEPVCYYIYEMPYRNENAAYKLKDARTLIQHCQDSFINKSINVIEVVLEEDVRNGSFAKTYGGFRSDPRGKDENIHFRPAGTYLTIASYSGGDNIVKLYRKLKKYADIHGYKVCGNAYEEDLLSHIVERDRQNYLVRCYLQVEQKQNK